MNVIVVSYDIADDKRRTKVADELESHGRRIQFSVFWCVLSERQRARLEARLDVLIDHTADQVLFFHLGPPEGRSARNVTSLGKAFEAPKHTAVIL